MDFEWVRAVIINRLIDLELEQWHEKEWGNTELYNEAMYAFIVLKNITKIAGFDIDEAIIRQTAMRIRARGLKDGS